MNQQNPAGMAPRLCRMLRGRPHGEGEPLRHPGTLVKSSLPPGPPGTISGSSRIAEPKRANHERQFGDGLFCRETETIAKVLKLLRDPWAYLHFNTCCCQVSPGPRSIRHTGTFRSHPVPPGTPHTQVSPQWLTAVPIPMRPHPASKQDALRFPAFCRREPRPSHCVVRVHNFTACSLLFLLHPS